MINLESLSVGAGHRVRRKQVGRRWNLSVVGALAMLGSVVLGGASANAAVSSNMCSFAIVVGVRGTGAPVGSNLVHEGRVWTSGGLGNQLAPLRTALVNVSDMPFYFLALAYPATAALQPSIEDGKVKLIRELNYINQACPYAPIILAGHSQGAQVISRMLTEAVPTPAGAPFGLNPSAKAAIKNVVLYGDPYYESGKITNYPNRSKNGLFSTIPYTKKNSLSPTDTGDTPPVEASAANKPCTGCASTATRETSSVRATLETAPMLYITRTGSMRIRSLVGSLTR